MAETRPHLTITPLRDQATPIPLESVGSFPSRTCEAFAAAATPKNDAPMFIPNRPSASSTQPRIVLSLNTTNPITPSGSITSAA